MARELAKFISEHPDHTLEVSLENDEGANVIVFRSRKKHGRGQAREVRVAPEEFGHIVAWLFETFVVEKISRRPLAEPFLDVVLERVLTDNADPG